MGATAAEQNYLQSAVQSASPIALTVLLYDRLVTDLRFAIEAMKKSDIEKRCSHMDHAFLVVGHLESNINHDGGGETAAHLSRFYACLRSQFIDAQIKNAPDLLEKQIELILQVRQAWQQVESKSVTAVAPSEAARPNSLYNASSSAMFQSPADDRPSSSSSWTA